MERLRREAENQRSETQALKESMQVSEQQWRYTANLAEEARAKAEADSQARGEAMSRQMEAMQARLEAMEQERMSRRSSRSSYQSARGDTSMERGRDRIPKQVTNANGAAPMESMARGLNQTRTNDGQQSDKTWEANGGTEVWRCP